MVTKSPLLPSAAVKARYQVTDMTLWRWANDPGLGFPEPMRIRGRKYWRESDLDAFDARCEAA